MERGGLEEQRNLDTLRVRFPGAESMRGEYASRSPESVMLVACMCIYIHIYTYMYMYIYIYIYLCIYVYMYI